MDSVGFDHTYAVMKHEVAQLSSKGGSRVIRKGSDVTPKFIRGSSVLEVYIDSLDLTDGYKLVKLFEEGVGSGLRALTLTSLPGFNLAATSILAAIATGQLPELRYLRLAPTTSGNRDLPSYESAFKKALIAVLESPKFPLEFLDLTTAFDKRKAFMEDILGALQHNWTLQYMLVKWPDRSMAARAELLLVRNRRLAGLDLGRFVTPSSGKVLFCGDGRVGKTTLRKALTGQRRAEGYKMDEDHSKRRVLGCMNGIQSLFHCTSVKEEAVVQGVHEPMREVSKLAEKPTRGWEVARLNWEDYQMVLLDCAGQDEYHVLHGFHLSELAGQATLFVLVCDGTLNDLEMAEKQLRYWLRYLASSSRSSLRVKVVVNERRARPTAAFWEPLLEVVADDFAGRIEFQGGTKPLQLDVLRPRQTLIESLSIELRVCVESMLKGSNQVPKEVDLVLQRLKAEGMRRQSSQGFPILTWGELETLFPRGDRRMLQLVVGCLHDSGELVNMGNEGNPSPDDLVVVDSQWFGCKVAGELLLPKEFWSVRERQLGKDGRLKLSRFHRSWKSIIDGHTVTAQALMEMLVKLELCYWTDEKKTEVLVPALLPPSSTIQEAWVSAPGYGRVVGRKLRCSEDAPEEGGDGGGSHEDPPLGPRDGVSHGQITLLPISIIYLLQVTSLDEYSISQRLPLGSYYLMSCVRGPGFNIRLEETSM